MEQPNLEEEDVTVEASVESLQLYSDTYPFRLSLRIRTFESEAEFVKFVRNCEKLVRGCLEYKLWKDYIVDVLGVNSCMITKERMDECTIEIHHHIPSLFILMKALVNRKLEQEEEFSTFDIAQEAIELHFTNRLGYVTLIKSIHEKFHNGFLDIPIRLVKGDYNYFLGEFSKYLEEDELETIQARMTVDENNCRWERGKYPGLMEATV